MTILTNSMEETSFNLTAGDRPSLQSFINDILLTSSGVLDENTLSGSKSFADPQESVPRAPQQELLQSNVSPSEPINDKYALDKINDTSVSSKLPSIDTDFCPKKSQYSQAATNHKKEVLRRRNAQAQRIAENMKKLAELTTTNFNTSSPKSDRRHSEPLSSKHSFLQKEAAALSPQVLQLERSVQMARSNLKQVISLQTSLESRRVTKNAFQQKSDENEKKIAKLQEQLRRERKRARHLEKSRTETSNVLQSRKHQHGAAAHKLGGQLCSLRGMIWMMDTVQLPRLQSKFAKIRLAERTLQSNISEKTSSIESQIYESDTAAQLHRKHIQVRNKFSSKNLASLCENLQDAEGSTDVDVVGEEMEDEVEMEVNMQICNLWSIQKVIENRMDCFDHTASSFPDPYTAMAFSENVKRLAKQLEGFASAVDDVSYLLTLGPSQQQAQEQEVQEATEMTKFDLQQDHHNDRHSSIVVKNRKMEQLRIALEMKNTQITELESHLDYYGTIIPSLEESLSTCKIKAEEEKRVMTETMEALRNRVLSMMNCLCEEGQEVRSLLEQIGSCREENHQKDQQALLREEQDEEDATEEKKKHEDLIVSWDNHEEKADGDEENDDELGDLIVPWDHGY